MSFFSIGALRTILTTETDADSPGSEELLGQLRENWEALLMLLLDTNEGGTVTTIAETVLTDSGQAWNTDAHIGRTLLITSGTAIGNTYTIDDNDGTTLTLTGDTLVSDGVIITDTFLIFYDLKVNADGHDHDGVNSKTIDVARPAGVVPDQYDATENAYTTKETWYVYLPADIDTVYFKAELKTTAGARTASWQLDIESATGEATHSGDANWTEKTGSVDVTGVAAGWATVLLQGKVEANGGETASIRYLSTYML